MPRHGKLFGTAYAKDVVKKIKKIKKVTTEQAVKILESSGLAKS